MLKQFVVTLVGAVRTMRKRLTNVILTNRHRRSNLPETREMRLNGVDIDLCPRFCR